MWAKQKHRGFTIVELLIVIVVIAILAAITIVAFNGIQSRARDTRRITDARSIIKALESYRALNGQFPAATPGCWENSSVASFMEYLTPEYGLSKVPVDPTNTNNFIYSYCRYSPGTNGCDISRGNFAVFTIKRLELSSSNPNNQADWVCSARDWNLDNGNEFMWSWGAYEN